MINDHLWIAEFTLQWAAGFVTRGDIYGAAGCFSRVGASLIQVLYAKNERYFLSDKAVRLEVPTFSKQPAAFMDRLADVLGCAGRDQQSLQDSLDRLTALWREVMIVCSQ